MMTSSGENLVPLVEGTGEIVPWASGGAVAVETLITLVRARTQKDLVSADLEIRLAELAKDDPEAARLKVLLAEAEAVEEQIMETLSNAIDAETRQSLNAPVSLDVGKVRVTWGKPPERYTMGVKERALWERAQTGDREAKQLVETLRIKRVIGDPPPPKVTIRGGEE